MTVQEWVVQTRRKQGLPPHVEEMTVLVDLAALVVESCQRAEGGAA